MDAGGPGLRMAKIVVEIGHGARPIWTTLKKMPMEDQLYLGLDIPADHWPPGSEPGLGYSIIKGRKAIDERRIAGGRCYWMKIGDDGNLPLRPGSVDELHMRYMLSDPRIPMPVIEGLLANVSLAMHPGASLVIDNFCERTRCGPGDVVVDFGSRRAVFRCDMGPLKPEESECKASQILNSNFTALPPEYYSPFLLKRGLGVNMDPDPGGRFTILIRR